MTIRIGKISYWHVHAWDYTKQAQEHPETEITAVWDEDRSRGEAAAAQLGVPYFASLDEMLDSGIDAVIVDAPTHLHKEVIIAAAKAGKHIFTEKVLAPTFREVNEILREVQLAKVKLTVSLPRLNDGYTLAIQEIISRGTLGRITQVRSRLSHDGATRGWLPDHFFHLEQCGGGALIDLGCHPMYLTRLFLGEEIESVSAQYGYLTGKEVEDNAAALLSTATGAVGIVEAGFVNACSPFTVEVHGTDSSLLYGTPENRLLLRTKESQDWQEIPLPANRESAFHQWVGHILNGTEAEDNIRMAVELTKLMEASNLSARERRTVQLTELQP